MQTNNSVGTRAKFNFDPSKPGLKRDSWLPYGKQSISESDISAVIDVLRSPWLTQGPTVPEFEKQIAGFCGAQYAVAFSSGTAALHAAYYAAGIGAGDEIVTTAMTFAATSNAALYLGAMPQFADIDLSTGLIDPGLVPGLINKKTKAIVGVDYAGHPCDTDQLRTLARSNNLTLIIDSAHSLGATYKQRPVGSLADMTTFSFHPVKTITTGEGGMVVTDREEFYRKLKLFRTHGIEKDPACLTECEGPWFHEMQLLGYNYRLTDIQAALGISQLSRLPEFIQRRRQIADTYRKHLQHSQLFTCLEEKSFAKSAYHLFPVLIDKTKLERKAAIEKLHAENIGVQVLYIPTYKHPYYRQFTNSEQWLNRCPLTEEFYSRVFSLPIFPAMSDADLSSVLAALDKLESEYAC